MNSTPASREETGQVPAPSSLPLLERLGNTPVFRGTVPQIPGVALFVKLEGNNPTGSCKDRAAYHVLKQGLASGVIQKGDTIIESSSGNFGISLGYYCHHFGLPFYCVIDPNIASENEALLRSICTKVLKVTQRDENGGYLLTRLSVIHSILASDGSYYWVNQYANPTNAAAYESLGEELCQLEVPLHYVFVGVSSCGTIMGVARRVKEAHPDCHVIAVDSIGSVIFGGTPKQRLIPGIGSSVVPPILDRRLIDDVVMVSEADAIRECHSFRKSHGFLIGGSSGAVIAAITDYFGRHRPNSDVNVAAIFHDRGERYLSTIYNEQWCSEHFPR